MPSRRCLGESGADPKQRLTAEWLDTQSYGLLLGEGVLRIRTSSGELSSRRHQQWAPPKFLEWEEVVYRRPFLNLLCYL